MIQPVNTTRLELNYKSLVYPTLAAFAVLYFFLFGFLRPIEFDSSSYIGAARFLFGLEGGYLDQSRITKPLVLLFPGLLEKFTGIHASVFFVFQNAFCFILSGMLVFQVALQIGTSMRNAFFAMLIYITCQPFAVYSLLVLTDVTGWMVSLLMIFLVLKWLQKSELSFKNMFLLGLIGSIGFLCKENALTGVLFAGCIIVVSSTSWFRKLQLISNLVVGFVLPVLLVTASIDYFYHDSEWTRLWNQAQKYSFPSGRVQHIEQIYHTLDVYYLILIAGILVCIKTLFRSTSGKELFQNQIIKGTLLALMIGIVTIPFANYLLDRILFMFAPFAIILMILCFDWFNKSLGFLVVAGGFCNILSAFLIYKFQIQGVLSVSLMLYLSLFAFIAIQNRIFQKLIN